MKTRMHITSFGAKLLVAMVIVSMLVASLPARAVLAIPAYDDLPMYDNVVFAEPVFTNDRPPMPFGAGYLTPITVGHGTAASPYMIHTAHELAWLSQQVAENWGYWGSPNRHFRLANNIDLSILGGQDYNWPWTPIGGRIVPCTSHGNEPLMEVLPFYGTFDGNGHTVRGLYLRSHLLLRPFSYWYGYGLFGVVGGTVKNIGVEGVIRTSAIGHSMTEYGFMRGHWRAGGIAGYLGNNGTMLNTSTIINSHFHGDIFAAGSVGGIVGEMGNNSAVLNCYSSGEINTCVHYLIGSGGWERQGSAGGIVGFSWASNVIISNNASSVYVLRGGPSGGIVGTIEQLIAGTFNYMDISNNIAMNPIVNGVRARSNDPSSARAGRIVGNVVTFNHHGYARNPLSGNSALASMQAGYAPFRTPASIYNVHDNINGADITGPIVSIGTAAGEPGEIIRVPVNLLNNAGIAGFNLAFNYDPNVVTPLNLDDAAIRSNLGGSVFVSNINRDAGTITTVWAAPYDVNATYLFSLYFEINDIHLNDNQTIRNPISVSIQEMKHANHDDADAIAQNGFIMIAQHSNNPSLLWGDVNQDGVVDIFDLIRLAQHIAWIPEMRLSGTGLIVANVFYDGRVDISDLIHMAQYLASEDMNNPDVILGPGSRNP